MHGVEPTATAEDREQSGWPFDLDRTTVNGRARRAALGVVANAEFEPTASVAFHSQGRLLIIGAESEVAVAIERLAPRLETVTVIWTGATAPNASPAAPNLRWIHATPESIAGHLGVFEVVFQGPDGPFGLDALAPDSDATIDLVLDLSDPSCMSSELAPPGYFAPQGNAVRFEQALEQIPELVGGFEQPQFVVYDASICAHARSGIEACHRCIDACSTDAITADGDGIRVDLNRCQGAGSCATACPAGALSYSYPRPADTLGVIKRMLRAYREAGGANPAILFHDAGAGREALQGARADLPDSVIPLEVEEVGSLGLDVWLSALAYGATQVGILRSSQVPASAVREIESQLSFAAALLEAMGYPSGAVQLMDAPQDEALSEGFPQDAQGIRLEPASFAAFNQKRTMIHLALGHLHQQSPAPRPLASLPTGAPFGEVWVNTEQCNLCMACVSQCPAKALQAGNELPQLKFVEDNCVQCGLCARTCPENAIGPSPRYLFDDLQRRRVRVLKEEEPFCCIACGKPFATRGVIATVLSKLQGHPMFGPAEMERLKMCEDCRIRALYDVEQRAMQPLSEEQP